MVAHTSPDNAEVGLLNADLEIRKPQSPIRNSSRESVERDLISLVYQLYEAVQNLADRTDAIERRQTAR